MTTNLDMLSSLGQSIWFDDINRHAINSGKLAELVRDYNVTGGTSNPTIFEKAFSSTDAYEEQFRQVAREGVSPAKIQDQLAITDVQLAADLFRDAYEASNHADGYASLEVSPEYAYDTATTMSETRRLFEALGRPNVMIKIPGTPAGLPAVQQCLAEGINVNITLLFAVEVYEQVAEAYLAALEQRVAAGQPIDNIASVASFFVSRVDVMVDERLNKLAEGVSGEGKTEILDLRGKAGIANARLAYEKYQAIIASERWQKLAAAGARPQRCLWASTSTKNPEYSDVMYFDNLIGPDTVNTLPEEAIYAAADHGTIANSLTRGMEDARRVMARLRDVGIDMADVTAQLQTEGVEKFAQSYQDALAAITEQGRKLSVG